MRKRLAVLKRALMTGCLLSPVAAGAQSFTTLYQFTGGADGAEPYRSPLVTATGALFGTAQAGGSDCPDSLVTGTGCGTLWRFSAGKLTPLVTFTGASNGASPAVQLLHNGTSLFGSALAGGSDNEGTLFKLLINAKDFSLLQSFAGLDGATVYSPVLLDKAGDLFGVTEYGGPNFLGSYGTGYGTLFEIPAGGTLTTLWALGGANGENPTHLVSDAAGNLYGGTDAGGQCAAVPKKGCGVIYEYEIASKSFKVLYTSPGGTAGYPPVVSGIDSKGNLFGKTRFGGSGYGTLFELKNDAGTYKLVTLWNFTGAADGAYPISPPLLLNGPTLYGVSTEGPITDKSSGAGVLWMYKAGKVTPLHQFTGGADGANPQSTPTFDRSGNIYGSTVNGGIAPCSTPSGTLISAIGCGTIYKYTP